ncbi:MAG: helix-turn-helix domain-containing protein [Actinomycetia bacterium]|nr:helix-turn-helix domain-containing protein [Actinomycetes bacterium]MCP3913109.1 helix-turn-helix domain-containing protein [Actinomycetes bacterium]MCP4085018.1 helix-turn-helix domain-containing protein [Actinomycetes bacterium]
MALLDLVAVEPRSLAALVEGSGCSRATTHRLAGSLEIHGLLRRDTEGRYALGVRLIGLGVAASRGFPLAAAAAPALAELRDRTGESVQLYVRRGTTRLCVAALESLHGLRTIVRPGDELTMQAGSAATILADDSDDQGSRWVASVGEREAGVASVSALVSDQGRVVAAVSVSGPIERTSREPGQRYGDDVLAAARRIERDAGLR